MKIFYWTSTSLSQIFRNFAAVNKPVFTVLGQDKNRTYVELKSDTMDAMGNVFDYKNRTYVELKSGNRTS